MRVRLRVRFRADKTFDVEKEAESAEEAWAMIDFSKDFDISQLDLDRSNFELVDAHLVDD